MNDSTDSDHSSNNSFSETGIRRLFEIGEHDIINETSEHLSSFEYQLGNYLYSTTRELLDILYSKLSALLRSESSSVSLEELHSNENSGRTDNFPIDHKFSIGKMIALNGAFNFIRDFLARTTDMIRMFQRQLPISFSQERSYTSDIEYRSMHAQYIYQVLSYVSEMISDLMSRARNLVNFSTNLPARIIRNEPISYTLGQNAQADTSFKDKPHDEDQKSSKSPFEHDSDLDSIHSDRMSASISEQQKVLPTTTNGIKPQFQPFEKPVGKFVPFPPEPLGRTDSGCNLTTLSFKNKTKFNKEDHSHEKPHPPGKSPKQCLDKEEKLLLQVLTKDRPLSGAEEIQSSRRKTFPVDLLERDFLSVVGCHDERVVPREVNTPNTEDKFSSKLVGHSFRTAQDDPEKPLNVSANRYTSGLADSSHYSAKDDDKQPSNNVDKVNAPEGVDDIFRFERDYKENPPCSSSKRSSGKVTLEESQKKSPESQKKSQKSSDSSSSMSSEFSGFLYNPGPYSHSECRGFILLSKGHQERHNDSKDVHCTVSFDLTEFIENIENNMEEVLLRKYKYRTKEETHLELFNTLVKCFQNSLQWNLEQHNHGNEQQDSLSTAEICECGEIPCTCWKSERLGDQTVARYQKYSHITGHKDIVEPISQAPVQDSVKKCKCVRIVCLCETNTCQCVKEGIECMCPTCNKKNRDSSLKGGSDKKNFKHFIRGMCPCISATSSSSGSDPSEIPPQNTKTQNEEVKKPELDGSPDKICDCITDKSPDKTCDCITDKSPDKTCDCITDKSPDKTCKYITGACPDKTCKCLTMACPDKTCKCIPGACPDKTCKCITMACPCGTCKCINMPCPCKACKCITMPCPCKTCECITMPCPCKACKCLAMVCPCKTGWHCPSIEVKNACLCSSPWLREMSCGCTNVTSCPCTSADFCPCVKSRRICQCAKYDNEKPARFIAEPKETEQHILRIISETVIRTLESIADDSKLPIQKEKLKDSSMTMSEGFRNMTRAKASTSEKHDRRSHMGENYDPKQTFLLPKPHVKFDSKFYGKEQVHKVCKCCAEDINIYLSDTQASSLPDSSITGYSTTTPQMLHPNHDILPDNILEVREMVNGRLRVYTEDSLEKKGHETEREKIQSSYLPRRDCPSCAEKGGAFNDKEDHTNCAYKVFYSVRGRLPKKVSSKTDVRTSQRTGDLLIKPEPEKEIPIAIQPTNSWPRNDTFTVKDVERITSKSSAIQQNQFQNKMWIFQDDMIKAKYGEGPPLVLKVRKSRLLEETFETLMCPSRIPLNYYREIRVYFKQENGCVEEKERSQDLFSLLSHQLFTRRHYQLFDRPSDDSSFLFLNPASPANPKVFQFAGVVFALSLMHGKQLGAKLPLAFFKCLLDRPFTAKDIEEIDPPLYQKIRWLKHNKLSSSNVRMTFTVKDKYGSQTYYKELVPDGSWVPVTDANKAGFIELAIKWKLGERCFQQLKEFRRGFVSVLEPCLLAIFTAEELQYLIGRAAENGSLVCTNIDLSSYPRRRQTW